MLNIGQNVIDGASHSLAEELLRETGEMRFLARGGSMVPAIYPGDAIVVQRAGITEIRIGEIVLFSRQGRWFLHRVRQILPSDSEPRLITQGDALATPDPPVLAEELLGRAIFLVRNGEQRALTSNLSVLHRGLRLAARHLPYFAALALSWHRHASRLKDLRGAAVVVARGKSQESI